MILRYEQQLVWDAILEEYKDWKKCINLILKTIRLHAALLGLFVLSPVLIISTIVLCFANQGKPFFFKASWEERCYFFRSCLKR
jgi:lipopolysaccharide/colanic/teichoic acid biosynthesis glycosyltransferase